MVAKVARRLLMFVVCTLLLRLAAGVMLGGLTEQLTSSIATEIPGGLALPWHQLTGDDLRRGDLHPDLVRPGQVVRRNGELVMLTDADDPDREGWISLEAEEQPAPTETQLMLVSLFGGTVVFALGMSCFSLIRPREEETPPPKAPEPLVLLDELL